ncbi:MAG: S8 family serine peptidase [Pseudomonadales bacterium]
MFFPQATAAALRCSALLLALCLSAGVAAQTALPADFPSDPQAIADYLDAIIDPSIADPEKFDRRDEIWDALPMETRDAVNRVYVERDDKQYQLVVNGSGEIQQALAVSGEEWAELTADFFVNVLIAEAQAGGELSVLAQIGDDLHKQRLYYGSQIEAIAEDYVALDTKRQLLEADKFMLESDLMLDQHGDSLLDDLFEAVETVSSEDDLLNRMATLDTQILALEGQLAETSDALSTLVAEAEGVEAALVNRGITENPELLAAEEERRFQEAVSLAQELQTKRAQYVSGQRIFDASQAGLGAQLEYATENGLDTAPFEARAEQLQLSEDMFVQSMQVQIASAGSRLQNALGRNALQKIGVTTLADLVGGVVNRGLDPTVVLETVDAQLILAFEQNALRQALGESDLHKFGMFDFAAEVGRTYVESWTSPEEYYERLGYYGLGLAAAGKDTVVDAYHLTQTAVEAYNESLEAAVNYGFEAAGSDVRLKVFGNETLTQAAGIGNELLKLDTKKVYNTTQGVTTALDRYVSQQAASGKAGANNMTYYVGYGTFMAAGVEEGVVKLAVLGGRYVKAVQMARKLKRAEQLATLSGDTARFGTAVADAAGARRGADAALTNAPAPPAAVTPTPMTFDPREMKATFDAFGNLTLQRAGGSPVKLGKPIGSGGFTDTYAVPASIAGGEGYVIKVTRGATGTPGGKQSLLPIDEIMEMPRILREAAANDDFGRQVINSLDPNIATTPAVLRRYQVQGGPLNGAVVSVVKRADAPDFGDVLTGKLRPDMDPQAMAAAARKTLDMTPAEAAAFTRFTEALADRGFVWMDNKGDNFAFVINDDGTVGVLVKDTGAMLKMKTPADAHALRQALDNPSPEFVAGGTGKENMARLKVDLDDRFNDRIDWDFVEQITGVRYNSLAADYPFLPFSGLSYPNLRAATAATPGPDFSKAASMAIPTPVNPAPAGIGCAPGTPTPAPVAIPAFFPSGTMPGWGRRLGFRDSNLPEFLQRPPQTANLNPGARGFSGSCPGLVDAMPAGSRPTIALGTPETPFYNQPLWDNGYFFAGRRLWNGLRYRDDAEPVDAWSGWTVPGDGVIPDTMVFETDHVRSEQKRSTGGAGIDQWALQAIALDSSVSKSRRSVTVAVVDTGLAWAHPDLRRDSVWINEDEIPGNYADDDGNGYIDDVLGWNFVNDNNLPWDLDGHGTLVAGVIAADAANDAGIRGVNSSVKIMPLRALDAVGESRASLVSEAIVYAADNGADIINLSVGGENLSKTEQIAIDYATKNGALVVVAAGNQGKPVERFGPAGASGVLTVAASGRDGARLALSNYGSRIDILAPGEDIVGLRAMGTDLMAKFNSPTYKSGDNVVGEDRAYYRATGTSFAAPLVSGVASLLLAANEELTPREAGRMLLQSATDAGAPGMDHLTGYGLLNARAALAADPDFYIEAQIAGVAVAARDGEQVLLVQGSADADDFRRARISIGKGEAPSKWRDVGELKKPTQGEIAAIPAASFAGATLWIIRLEVRHDNGRTREYRFKLNLG